MEWDSSMVMGLHFWGDHSTTILNISIVYRDVELLV